MKRKFYKMMVIVFIILSFGGKVNAAEAENVNTSVEATSEEQKNIATTETKATTEIQKQEDKSESKKTTTKEEKKDKKKVEKKAKINSKKKAKKKGKKKNQKKKKKDSWSHEFHVTAYCGCYECSEQYGTQTSTGVTAESGRTIAVDPEVIPYGSKVEINGHIYTAEDCGGAINGYDIDIFMDDHEATDDFGSQYKKCTLKNK